jgi:hypothetical protein
MAQTVVPYNMFILSDAYRVKPRDSWERSYVGFFGGIVRNTNVEMILQLDCLATDFFHDRAFPTYLYYNPYDITKEVQIDVGPQSRDLFDAATDRFLKKNVRGVSSFPLAVNTAAVVVMAPTGGTITYKGNRTLIMAW